MSIFSRLSALALALGALLFASAALACDNCGGGYYGGGWGGPVAAGVIGGLALGALAGSAYGYGPAYYGYGRCYWQNQPAYDAWGNFSGYQPVQVCY